jgi:hypothetical protein
MKILMRMNLTYDGVRKMDVFGQMSAKDYL